MKHLQSFDEFINESEINIFDLVGKPLETIRASVEDLLKKSDKIEDEKWIPALKEILKGIDKLDSIISKAESKLGVIPIK